MQELLSVTSILMICHGLLSIRTGNLLGHESEENSLELPFGTAPLLVRFRSPIIIDSGVFSWLRLRFGIQRAVIHGGILDERKRLGEIRKSGGKISAADLHKPIRNSMARPFAWAN